MVENNEVCVTGEIVSGFTLSHEMFREGFYLTGVAVNRLNGQADIIPLMISERLISINENCEGCTIEAQGQFRPHNRHEKAKNRPVLSIFMWEITFMEKFTNYTKTNQIFLDDYICKVPIYRKTPLGREITDLPVAVDRPYGKSNYIPYIAWGRNARYTSGFKMGAHVKLWGRVQSREYAKKINDNECREGIAYKVSVSELESGGIEMRKEM